ncbi:MAG: PAS domain S-box protein [Candidatus Obscuribacterales bacterium]|nr:PAS domain S-box protein [Candidatus Obscuribacterales bacterium]
MKGQVKLPYERLMRVLVVEDSFTQAQIHQMNLLRRGFQVEWVTNLHEVLLRLQGSGIDVVLLDLSLPDSRGIDTFFRVRDAGRGVPIVVMSALDDEDVAMEALHGGAQDYLIKGQASNDMLVRCLRYAFERGRVEQELREGEKRLRLIIENSYDAFIAFDATGKIGGWNRQAENTFGWQTEEILGMNLADTIIPSRYLSAHKRDMFNLMTRGVSKLLNRRAEMQLMRKDGREIPVEIALFPVRTTDVSDSFCAFLHDISARREMEKRNKEWNDELERRVQERTGELRRSNAELQQFAKIASHDLQEPIRAIQGYAQLLGKRYKGKLDTDANEFIDYILDGCSRMVKLIQAVLQHASIGTTDVKAVQFVDCRVVLEEVLANLKAGIEESRTRVVVGEMPTVVANRTEMVQLFQNLIGNAIKYRGPDRDPEIYISSEANVHEWVFSVRDNGIGIDPRYTDKIFDMFARLHGKTQYSGTGIGLAICKKIVETHGGRIWVESELGNGSIFLFTILRFRKADDGREEVVQ